VLKTKKINSQLRDQIIATQQHLSISPVGHIYSANDEDSRSSRGTDKFQQRVNKILL
jgi:hypothetical protein